MPPDSSMSTIPSPPEPGAVRTVIIPEGRFKERLDKLVAELVPEISRSHWKELIEDGRVTVDDVECRKPGTELNSGARIAYTLAPRRKLRVEQGDASSLRVLFEDEALIVIDKPAGVLAHPTDTASGATVSDLAALRYGALPTLQGADRPGIVHRLDAGTSGVMVLARTEAAFAHLMQQFRQREVEKSYLALVYGEPRFDTGWVHAPIDREKGDSSRMVVAHPGEGRPASTYYEVKSRFRSMALIAAQPKTGRTHQIRVHLTHAEMPLVGDKLYKRKGGPLFRFPAEAPVPERQCLHAATIRFRHPTTNEPVEFEAPLAEDFARMLAWVREHMV